MKTVKMFVDEISGKVFESKSDAIKSENRSVGIKKLFSFWKPRPKQENCEFENGGWCYQRSSADYSDLVDALIQAVKDYEPWIAKQYEKDGGLQRRHIGSGYIIGRYLCDGNSEMYPWYSLISNICPKCFREWGQPYYANNCSCLSKPRSL